MAGEVIAVAKPFRDEDGVLLEVDALDMRTRRKSWALEHDELVPLAQASPLRSPGRTAAGDAAMDENQPLHMRILVVTKWVQIEALKRISGVTKSGIHPGMLRAMEPSSRPTFSPAGAGGLLLSTTAASIGIGSLVGWAAGNWAYGALAGAVVGVPLSIGVVYRTYGDAFK